MSKRKPEYVTVDEAVALILNHDLFEEGVTLIEFLDAIVDSAEKKEAACEIADDFELYQSHIEASKARLAFAEALQAGLKIEMQRLDDGYESTIERGDSNNGKRLILTDSLDNWAWENFWLTIPTQEEKTCSEYTWHDITISLMPNERIEIKSKNTVIADKHLTEVGLKGKKKTSPNESFGILLGMANNKKFPPSSRTGSNTKQISSLRKILQTLTNINRELDPFLPFNKTDGWRPSFQLVDKRNAGDQRAKEKATHIPFDEAAHSNKQDRTYESSQEKDDADQFIEDHGG